MPEGKHDESPAETRETALNLIKEKLNINLNGTTSACRRLRKKKQIFIKFQDLDKTAVYEAKFNQTGDSKDFKACCVPPPRCTTLPSDLAVPVLWQNL